MYDFYLINAELPGELQLSVNLCIGWRVSKYVEGLDSNILGLPYSTKLKTYFRVGLSSMPPKKIHPAIMNNPFLPHKEIDETYDLKGLTVGRGYPEAKTEKSHSKPKLGRCQPSVAPETFETELNERA